MHPPFADPLAPFVEDELLRAPLLADALLQTLERPRAFEATPGSTPRWADDLRAALLAAHAEMVASFCASLRSQLDGTDRPGPAAAEGAPSAFSLVDEDAISADVELSRVVEAVASVAEHELRELRAYTSALVGDLQVSRDTHPLGPAVYARALWAAAGALPLSQGFRVAFMRRAALPLAQSLRLAYAAACTRLEDAGVEPAAYRTLVLSAGSRTVRPDEAPDAPPPDLPTLRDSMPVPLGPSPSAVGAAAPKSTTAAGRVDAQLIELITRIFDAMLTGASLAPRVQWLLSRLQPSALRSAMRDPAALESYEHPLWRFMDRLAFIAALHDADGEASGGVFERLQALVDNLAREPEQDAALFAWAIERLAALERHLFERRLQAAAADIAALQALPEAAASAAPLPSAFAPLDVATLDTVPADLLPDAGPAGPPTPELSPHWLDGQRPGAWVCAFLAGEWRLAVLLWRSDAVWLYAAGSGANTWALRRAALERLQAEGLLRPWSPRSLVRDAAARVLKRAQPAAR